MRSSIRQLLRRTIQNSTYLRTLQNTEYQGQAARPSKFASRTLAWIAIERTQQQGLVVYETNSYPGVLSTFYLALGARVILNDPDEKLLNKVRNELHEGHGEFVRDSGSMDEADIIDLDPLSLPSSTDFLSAARTRAILVATDASGINRRRNGPIPELFRELAGSPQGRWNEEKREPEALWDAVARAAGRSVRHFICKSGSAPAWYVVM